MSKNEVNIENEIEEHPESYLDDSDADFLPIQYSESESEDELNENPEELQNELPTNEFCNEIGKSKYKLYKIIVLAPIYYEIRFVRSVHYQNYK